MTSLTGLSLEDIPRGAGESIDATSILTLNRKDPDLLNRVKQFFETWQSAPEAIAKIDGEKLYLFSALPVKSDTPEDIILWIREHRKKNWDWLERTLGLSDAVDSPPFEAKNPWVDRFLSKIDFNEYQWLRLFSRALRKILPRGISSDQATTVKLGVATWRWEYNHEKNMLELNKEPHIVVFQTKQPRGDELTSIWYSLENIHLLSGLTMRLLTDWKQAPELTSNLSNLSLRAQEMCSAWLLSHHNIKHAAFYDSGNPLLTQTPRYHKLVAASQVKPLIMALFSPAGISSEELIQKFNLSVIEPEQLKQLIDREQTSPPQNLPDEHIAPVGNQLVATRVKYRDIRKHLTPSSPAVKYLDKLGRVQIETGELYATLKFFEHPEFDYRLLVKNNLHASIINNYLKSRHSEIMQQHFQYFRQVKNDLGKLSQFSLELKDFLNRIPPEQAKEFRFAETPGELLHALHSYNTELYNDLISRLMLDYRNYQHESAAPTASGDCPECLATPAGGATNLQPVPYSQLAPQYCDEERRLLSCGACDQCGATLFMIDYRHHLDYVGNPVIAHCTIHNRDICQNCLKEVNCPVCQKPMQLITPSRSGYSEQHPDGYIVGCDQCSREITNVDNQGKVTSGRELFNRCTGQDKHDICQSCTIARQYNLPAHPDNSRQYAFRYHPQSHCSYCQELIPVDTPVVYTTDETGDYTGLFHTQCINKTHLQGN